MGRPSMWGASGLSHRLGIPVLESCKEQTSTLGCRENCWDRQKGWRSLDSTHEEYACAGLPKIRAERALHWQLPLRHTPQSELVEHPGPAHSIPQPSARFGPTKPWEETWSSYAETDWGSWDVTWVEWRWPLSALAQVVPQEHPAVCLPVEPMLWLHPLHTAA